MDSRFIMKGGDATVRAKSMNLGIILISLSFILFGNVGGLNILHAQDCRVARIGPTMLGGGVSAPAGCTPSYGAELATESNATDDAGGNETDAVTPFSALGSPTLDSITTAPQTGTYHLEITASGSAEGARRYLPALDASTVYSISFYARHTGVGTNNGEMRCSMLSGITPGLGVPIIRSIAKAETTYAKYEKYFYFNTDQDVFLCYEINADNDGGIYIDNFSIKTATLCYGDELNGGANAASLTNETNATTGFTSTGTSTFESSATNPADGSYSLHTVVNASAGRMYIDTATLMAGDDPVEGKKYFISWKQKYTAGAVARCGFTASTGFNWEGEWVDLLAADTAWTHIGFSFTYDPAIQVYWGCKENGAGDDSEFYIDSLSIKEITSE